MCCWLGEGVGPGNPGRRGPLEVEGSQAPLRQAGHRSRKAETAQTPGDPSAPTGRGPQARREGVLLGIRNPLKAL